ncbi:MAG: alanine racemase [Pseudomonadota bacterium]
MSERDAPTAPLRLRLSREALIHNWRWLHGQSFGAACGAAIKADGYGLGAIEVAEYLAGAGCRDFFVATWAEAEKIAPIINGCALSVLHGVRPADLPMARDINARPVLNSTQQVKLWRESGGGQCDVMIDTGMNRLGLSPEEVSAGALDGLSIHTAMSHLASADEGSAQNAVQLRLFTDVKSRVMAQRYSLANSAGICLGRDYCFDLTRPGLSLYGGVPRVEAEGHIRQVVTPEAEVLQVRDLRAGDHVGYNATWAATTPCRIATINLGYADGYLRGFSDKGSAHFAEQRLPVVGRVSMDIVTLLIPDGCKVQAGDWVSIDYHLPSASVQSGLSQYELLTGLGQRYERVWE